MQHLIDAIIHLPLPLLHHWGYAIVFVASVLEAVPLLGMIVPGQLLIILGGFFVKQGVLRLFPVMVLAAIGAVLGDVLGYWFGKRHGQAAIRKYGRFVFFKEAYIEKTKALVTRHTGKTLIIGRFHSLTRALSPFVAGLTEIPFGTFLLFDIIGGVSWAVCFVLVGYIFGASYEIASQYIGKFIFLATVLGIALVYGYQFINKHRHIFSRYHLYALILNLISLYFFAKLMEDVSNHESIIQADVWVNVRIALLANPVINHLFLFVTNSVHPAHIILASVVLLIILIYKKKWYFATLLVCGVSGGFFFELLFKAIVHRLRPENALLHASGYSFPSGHATLAIIFFSLLLYSFKDDIKNNVARYVFVSTCILLFLLVGFSRVYLRVHWLTDIVAGFALGLFWLTLLILVFRILLSVFKKSFTALERFLEEKLNA